MGGDGACPARMARRRGALTCTLAALAAVAGLAACDAPTADERPPGYDPTQLTGGLVYRWPLGRTVAIYADPTAAWESVVFYREFELRLVDDPRAADVIVHHRQAPRLVDVMDCEPPGVGGGKTVFCNEEPEAPVLPLLDGGGGRVKV